MRGAGGSEIAVRERVGRRGHAAEQARLPGRPRGAGRDAGGELSLRHQQRRERQPGAQAGAQPEQQQQGGAQFAAKPGIAHGAILAGRRGGVNAPARLDLTFDIW